MFRIGIVDIKKDEVLKELTNEFLMPREYTFDNLQSMNESIDYVKDYDVLINPNEITLPIASPKGIVDRIDTLSDTEKTELVKRELFNKLVEIKGYYPDWGTLTGVRPVKLAGELIEKFGKDQTYRFLKDYYLLSEKKIKSIIDIYEYQISSIGKPEHNSVSLYIGIPFCPTRCLYCSFASNQVSDKEIERYLPALIHEIEAVSKLISERGYVVESIYMGGGTPTTLSTWEMDSLLTEVDKCFKISSLKEFTVEAGRPDTIDYEKLLAIRDHGVGRISINPQSMKDRTLELIGRHHTAKDIERAFGDAMEVGFDSINCDLIAGLPEEDLLDMQNSIYRVMELGADNITVHNLAVKRASRLNEKDPEYHYRQAKVTSEMIMMADEILKSKGFNPYYLYRQKHMAGSGENTGYCLPGKEGIYNIRIMDEHQTIIAMGAGGITKYYHPEENRLERVPNVTNYEQYIDRIDEMIERKILGGNDVN